MPSPQPCRQLAVLVRPLTRRTVCADGGGTCSTRSPHSTATRRSAPSWTICAASHASRGRGDGWRTRGRGWQGPSRRSRSRGGSWHRPRANVPIADEVQPASSGRTSVSRCSSGWTPVCCEPPLVAPAPIVLRRRRSLGLYGDPTHLVDLCLVHSQVSPTAGVHNTFYGDVAIAENL